MSAERIDPTRAKMPQPTAALYDAMVYAGCKAFNESLEGNPAPTATESTSAWYAAARAMYGAVAKAGGARVEQLKGGVE